MMSLDPLSQSGSSKSEISAAKASKSNTQYQKLDEQMAHLSTSIKTSSLYQTMRSIFFLTVPKGKEREKCYFRLNAKAASRTVTDLKKKLNIGNETDSVIQHISKKVALGCLSRLYTIATAPYQLLRDFVYMPERIVRAVYKAHDQANLQRDPTTKKISALDLMKVSGMAAVNMTKVLLSPLTTLVSLTCITVLGLENMGGKSAVRMAQFIKHFKPDLKEPPIQQDSASSLRLLGQSQQLKEVKG